MISALESKVRITIAYSIDLHFRNGKGQIYKKRLMKRSSGEAGGAWESYRLRLRIITNKRPQITSYSFLDRQIMFHKIVKC